MISFELIQQAKIVFGAGKVSLSGQVLKQAGLHHAFVVCDAGVVDTGILAQVIASLENAQMRSTIYDGVRADPPVAIIREAASQCRTAQCDCVIAVGGGSSIDTGKGVNLLRYNAGDILDYAAPNAMMQKAEHLMAIPTTSGTGSELSDGLIVTDETHQKRPILAANAMVEFVVLDPKLAEEMPPSLTATTGFDALAHAIESYTSTAATAFSDQISLSNIRTILEWLPQAIADGHNLEARTQMMAASTLAGWMLCYGHTNAGHSMAHVLGAQMNWPHGIACAAGLPWVLEFNADAQSEKTKQLAKFFGCKVREEETPAQIGACLRVALIRYYTEVLQIKLPKTQQLTQNSYRDMAQKIVEEPFQQFNPRRMTLKDAEALLHNVFQ